MKKVWNLAIMLLLVTAMVLPVFAESVDSVRQQGAPTVLEVETVEDEKVTVVVTPLAEQEKASWTVQQEIKTATKALNEGDLTKVKAVQEAVNALNELNAALQPGEAAVKPGTPAPQPGTPAETIPQQAEVKVENLVVSEVFHVDASHTNVAITFEAESIRTGQFLMVMVFVDGQWQVLDFDAVEIIEDGKVKITFERYGTVAFIVDQTEVEQFMAEDAAKEALVKNTGKK